jgi:hypothetical protein
MPGMEQRMRARSWILAGVQRPVTSNAAAAVVRPDGHHAGGRRPAGSGVGRVACGTRWSSRTWSTRPYRGRVTRCRVPDSYQKRGTPPGLSRAVSGLLYGLTFNPVLIIVFGFLVNLFERGYTALAYAYSPELFDTRSRSLGTSVSYG